MMKIDRSKLCDENIRINFEDNFVDQILVKFLSNWNISIRFEPVRYDVCSRESYLR